MHAQGKSKAISRGVDPLPMASLSSTMSIHSNLSSAKVTTPTHPPGFDIPPEKGPQDKGKAVMEDFDPSTNMQTKNFIDVGPLEDQHILAKPQEAHPGPELQLGGGPRSHTVPGGTGDGGGQELP